MTKFSKFFNLNKKQAELDFIDIDPQRDMPLFIDPFTISNHHDAWSNQCNENITSFFQTILNCIKNDQQEKAKFLLNQLKEPNETCLGFSKNNPQGRGVSGKQALDLFDCLKNSKAAKSGLITQLAECDLFVENMGPDKISDITTNILRGLLIQYTQAQCNLHGIELKDDFPSGCIWNKNTSSWERTYVKMPIVDGKPVLLVPKYSVRWSMALNNDKFYNHFILDFLREENLRLNSSLVETLRSGVKRVTKVALKAKHPKNKDYLTTFSQHHPDILEKYKNICAKSSKDKIRNDELERKTGGSTFDDTDFARFLQSSLDQIPTGNTDACNYHNFMIGVMQFIFDSQLIYPQKETEINEGRKRIDITYTNAAEKGFFSRILKNPEIAAQYIMIECKNYSNDPKNPELDQLRGRFSPRRGKFGILLYRNTSDRNLLIQRCRDIAIDCAGFIIPLGDAEIHEMLDIIISRNRGQIDGYIQNIYNKLLV